MSATTVRSPSRAAHGACRAATSRWSGTTSRAPRPAARWRPRPRRAGPPTILAGQGLPHRVRRPGPRPARRGTRPGRVPPQPAVPGGVRARRRVAPGRGVLGLHPGVPGRHRQPQHVGHRSRRSGRRRARHRAATSGVSTGSGETTFSSQAQSPPCSVDSARSSRKPSTAGRRTAPAPAPRAPPRRRAAAAPVVEGPVEVGEGDVDGDRATGRVAAGRHCPRPGRSRHRSSSAGRCGPAAPARGVRGRPPRPTMVVASAAPWRSRPPPGNARADRRGGAATPGSPGRAGVEGHPLLLGELHPLLAHPCELEERPSRASPERTG